MKKVLFVATVDSHILCFHIPYLKYFKGQGYEVHVATNGSEDIPFCDKHITIPFERSPFKLNNIKSVKLLKEVIDKEKYDIIHCHTPMGAAVTRLAAKDTRKKNHTRVIYTAHGFHFYKGAPIKNWLIFYPVEKYLSRYTDTLITINKEDYELASKKFHCPIEYVPGVGIDPDKLNVNITKKDKHALRKSLGLKDSDFVMIYPAELSYRKNQEFLIKSVNELIKKHKDIHILLPGRDSLEGRLQVLVDELDLNNNIHFLGFRKDIPYLLRMSDMLVSTSRQEGLPVNVMEAMYVGLPMVVTDCRGNSDLVDNNKNGYVVNQNDVKEFVKKIKKIYSNKIDLVKIREYDQEKIKKYYLENIMKDMKTIYEKD